MSIPQSYPSLTTDNIYQYQYQQSYCISSNPWTDHKKDNFQLNTNPISYIPHQSQYAYPPYHNPSPPVPVPSQCYSSLNLHFPNTDSLAAPPAYVDIDIEDWDSSPAISPVHPHFSLSQSHPITYHNVQSHPQVPSRIKQEDLSVYTTTVYPSQSVHNTPNSPQPQVYDLPTPSLHDINYISQSPNQQSSYSQPSYYDASAAQDQYVHPAELSPPGLSMSLSPHSPSDGTSDGTDPDDFDADADGEPDVDADGEDESKYPHEPDLECDQEPDYEDDGDGEYIFRSRNASFTFVPSEGRTLRRRSSVRGVSEAAAATAATAPARFNPYTYNSLTQTRPRRASSNPTPLRSSMQSTLFAQNGSVSESSQTRKRTRTVVALPVPIPVPNLTKKSRGRRVPTVTSMECGGRGGQHRGPNSDGDHTGGKRGGGARTYTCKVNGCGKCFARGEHLKRHVRSIHTYEKRRHSPPCFFFFFCKTNMSFSSSQVPVPRVWQGLQQTR